MTKLKKLVPIVVKEFKLRIDGDHGIIHWARVLENGRKIANATTGVNLEVVEHFALLHDICRIREWGDEEHSSRGARFVRAHRSLIDLTDNDFSMLLSACALHNNSHHKIDNITVGACLDSDRLDLGRIGILPDPNRLFTEIAKSDVVIIESTVAAWNDHVPALIKKEWGFNFWSPFSSDLD